MIVSMGTIACGTSVDTTNNPSRVTNYNPPLAIISKEIQEVVPRIRIRLPREKYVRESQRGALPVNLHTINQRRYDRKIIYSG